MNKYTAEQARSSLQKMLGHPLTVAERAELFSMASNYADLLRERESAKPAVTDGMVDAAMLAYNVACHSQGDMRNAHVDGMQAALEAVAPMLAGARVPERKPLPNLLLAQYHEAVGWNACRDAMLAAAPKPKKE